MLNRILENYPNEDFLIADGFNNAIIGVDTSTMRLIYSTSKCIEILLNEGMNEEHAYEYFEYNVVGAYMGSKTPIWCEDDKNILEEMNIKEIEGFLRKKKLENLNK